MLVIGYLLLASLFLFASLSHIKSSAAMVGYTAQSLGDCPVKQYIAPLGGWPTGVFLAVTGTLIAFQNEWGLALAAGFLLVATLVFHRKINPDTFKNVALLGAVIALMAG